MTTLLLASTHVHDGHHATGHPLWHYLVVAVAAVAVFVGILVREYVQLHPRRRANAGST